MDFDLGSFVASKNISNILREVSRIDDFHKKSSLLDFHVHALEEEIKKIEAFKRELPHCMQLLKDAIEKLKAEKGRQVRPAVEESTPFKSYGGEGRVKASNGLMEKKNWMSTPFKLCTRNQDSIFHLRSRLQLEEEEEEGSGRESKFRKERGAFLPFEKPEGGVGKEKQRTAPIEGSSLGVQETEAAPNGSTKKRDYGFGKEKLHQPHQEEQQKKQRRCWSPELHKIFVGALHQLGGAQTATPKQIRELMKVEGLTNDEVKSHLQKYRIHIKKVDAAAASSSMQLAVAGSPQGPLNGGGQPPEVKALEM